MTRKEARAIYHAGEEAVVCALLAMNPRIHASEKQVTELTTRLERSEQQVRELEGQIAKNSRNSSKPPSSDGYKKPAPKSLRKKTTRKTGGQPGHQGKTLPPVEKPDRIRRHRVKACACCGKTLSHEVPAKTERRQVFDLPPLRLEVTEHQAETKLCDCGHLNHADFPAGVNAPTQYGAGIKAAASYLKTYQLLPYARACELLGDFFGAAISQGTLATILSECASLLESPVEQIKKQIAESAVVHFDETGARAENKLHWVHTASTQNATYYQIHPRKGTVAMDDINILPGFTGRAVHDHHKAYFTYDCDHSLCNAHHLRELIFVLEQLEQTWAKEMIDCLLEIKEAVDQTQPAAHQFTPQQIQQFEKDYQQIIDRGYAQNPILPPPKEQKKKRGRAKKTKPRNLLERLDTYREQTLAFMYDFQVPFDNNLAERDLRMIKVQQKISGTFRTMKGAEAFSRTRSYLSTARKNGKGAYDALKSLFAGHPYIPSRDP